MSAAQLGLIWLLEKLLVDIPGKGRTWVTRTVAELTATEAVIRTAPTPTGDPNNVSADDPSKERNGFPASSRREHGGMVHQPIARTEARGECPDEMLKAAAQDGLGVPVPTDSTDISWRGDHGR
jgi:hypothetical protein